MSNDRINEMPICAKLLYRPQIICDGRVVAESDCVNPDGLEAAALIKELVDALEAIQVDYCRELCGGVPPDGDQEHWPECAKAAAALERARR
jgi:hypothetical protein